MQRLGRAAEGFLTTEQSSGTKMLREGEGSRQGTAVTPVVLKQSWIPAPAPGDVQGQGM